MVLEVMKEEYLMANRVCDKFLRKHKRAIQVATVVLLVVMCVCTAFASGDAAANGLSDAYKSLARSIFNLVRGVMVTTACVVCIIALFLMMLGINDKDVESGIRKIRRTIVIIAAAWAVPLFLDWISGTLNGTQGGVKIDDVHELT